MLNFQYRSDQCKLQANNHNYTNLITSLYAERVLKK